LYLKLELLSWPLHSVKRKPLLAQLINYHNNRGKNVYSILLCLREMNRINRHFVYVSTDTTCNRLTYMTVFVKMWFITIFNANVNISRVLKWYEIVKHWNASNCIFYTADTGERTRFLLP
jgi:hypothetical protein